jgi:hypothetical protein
MGITWDENKDERLRASRGIGFVELTAASVPGIVQHPTRKNQKLLLFEVDGYVWAAPCVSRGDELFLKTAFPSRKYTKLWRFGELP